MAAARTTSRDDDERIRSYKEEIQRLAGYLRDEIKDIIRTIDKHRKVSGGVAIVGGAVALVGLVTSVFTFGAAAPIAAAGAAMAGGGALTFSVAALIGLIMEKHNIDKIDSEWTVFATTFLRLYEVYFDSEMRARAVLLFVKDAVEGKTCIDEVKCFFRKGAVLEELEGKAKASFSKASLSFREAEEHEQFVKMFLFTIRDLIGKFIQYLKAAFSSSTDYSLSSERILLDVLVIFFDMIARDTV